MAAVRDPTAHISDRKRANRKLKQIVNMGILSEEQASQFFRKDTAAAAVAKEFVHNNKQNKNEAAQGVGKGGGKRGGKSGSYGRSKRGGKTSAAAFTKGGAGTVADPRGRGGSLGVPRVNPHRSTASTDNAVVVIDGDDDYYPPAAFAYTKADVDQMFLDGYYTTPETPFWDGKDLCDLVRGSCVLWKVARPGAMVVYMNAKVQGWKDYNIVLIRCDATGHSGYVDSRHGNLVGDPHREYCQYSRCTKKKGECVKIANVYKACLNCVRCIACGSVFKSQSVYIQHYELMHGAR
jgi:hypothetical protein